MRILAIDTSCDETAIAVVRDRTVLAHAVYSQVLTHTKWGGVVPNLARKEHEEHLPFVFQKICRQYIRYLRVQEHNLIAYTDIEHMFSHIDAIAVTQGPGLAIALEIGIQYAKTLAQKYNKPLIPTHHMTGHLYAVYAQNICGNPSRPFTFPALGILASGGHTEIVLWKDHGSYEILSETLDDAAGEALDKSAKMLGLGYPGAPVIERLAQTAKEKDMYVFPRAMRANTLKDMSFSGLKTAFFYYTKQHPKYLLPELASSIQEAIFDTLFIKVKQNITKHKIKAIVCGGGVVVNKRFRVKLRQVVHEAQLSIPIWYPPYKYLCGDNAVMIGIASVYNPYYEHNFDRIPRISLEVWGSKSSKHE